jgi:AcrR family transcriptional regulator
VDTKTEIINAGIRLWRAGIEPSARRIASECGLGSHAAVLHHFITSKRLYDALAAEAVRIGESRIIVKLIASGHPSVSGMPDADRVDHVRRC